MSFASCRPPTHSVLFAIAAGLLAACAELPARSPVLAAPALAVAGARPARSTELQPLLSREDLALLEESVQPAYRIGSGDVLRLDVVGRPEVSGRHVVGPDGVISVPLVGNVDLRELTREEAVRSLDSRLRAFYSQPQVTLAVDEYVSNQVAVFGRVERAGMQRFAHPPTLVEVLANAGAMPLADKQSTLSRCAILRGREKLIWVDLRALVAGDAAYNLRMKKGDIVYIPDVAETSVYVLGAVARPGAYRLAPRMTLLDALAQAGGPNENASPEKIGLYRAGAGRIEVIEFAALIDPARSVNFALEDGDVLFLPQSGLADFGFLMRQLAPAMSVFTFGATLSALKP